MKHWLPQPTESVANNGDFTRCDLTLEAQDRQKEFLAEFGCRVIQHYVAAFRNLSCLGITWHHLDATRICRRIFDANRNHTDVFVRFAGEVLAAWAEESFTANVIARPPVPHDTTPAFDAIALEREGDSLYLRFIQAKTTREDAGGNANAAAVRFGQLDGGAFDIELMAALEEIAEHQTHQEDKARVLKCMVDPSARRYRIVVVHGETAPQSVLGAYDTHVRGDQARRAATFLRLPNWEEAWNLVGATARAEARK